MNRMPLDLLSLHDALLKAYGRQDWWPGREDPFEVIVGAILTQRTTWTNVAKVIDALRRAELMTPEAIRMAEDRRVEDLIRPTGFYRAKTTILKAFCSLLRADYDGDLLRLFTLPLAELRAWLLSVHGIGNETADAILVYAAGKASFVIDAYTRRLLTRLGSIGGNESYQWLQDVFTEALPADVSLFAEYHALIVHHAKTHCLSRPRCEGCPLACSCDFAKQEEESG